MKKLYLLPLYIVFVFQITYGQTDKNETVKVFEDKADTLSEYFKFDSAASYYCKAAKWYEQEQMWLLSVKDYRLTSKALIKAAKYDTAYYYSRKALDLTDKHFQESNKDEMFEKSDVYLNMADIHAKKGKYKEGLSFCKNALALIIRTDSSDCSKRASIWKKTGVAYNNLGKPDSALLFCENALKVYITTMGEHYLDVADNYNNIGIAYRSKGFHDKALEYFQKALAMFSEATGGQHLNIAACYSNIGSVYYYKVNYDLALEYYQKALTIRITTLGKQHPDVARSYNNIGSVYKLKGDNDKALEYYRKNLDIDMAVLGDQHPYVAATYDCIGYAYQSKGEYEKALKYFHKALPIHISALGENHPYVAINHSNVGNVYLYTGDYDKALAYYQKALNIYLLTLGEQHPYVAPSYNGIGAVYYLKEDYDKALEYFQKALKVHISALGEQHPDIAEDHNHIGETYLKKGYYEKALEYFQKALKMRIAALGEWHTYVASCYYNIGQAYSGKRDYDKALEYFRKDLKINIAVLGEHHPNVAYSYNDIGEIYNKKGKFEKALEYYQKALMGNIVGFTDTSIYVNPALEKISSETALLITLTGKADAFYQLYKNTSNLSCDIEASLSTYELAFQLINSMKNGYNIEDTKLQLSDQTKNYYSQAANVAKEYARIKPSKDNYEKAFQFIEQGKGATLADRFNEFDAKRFTDIPDSLLETEKELRTSIGFFNTQIAKERSQKEGYDTLKVNAFENEKFTCARKLDSLIAWFESTYPAYYELKYAEKIASVSEIQENLDRNSAILNYFIGDSSLFIATITDSLYKIEEVPLENSFKNLVIAYYRNFKAADPTAFVSNSRHIYEKLIKPVNNYIAGKNHLVIIPDDYLYYLPFETLIDNISSPKITNDDYSKLNYLIKSHSISYHHSVTLWCNSQKKEGELKIQQKMNFIGFAPVFSKENNNGIILSSNVNALDTTNNLAYRSVSTDLKRFNPLPYSRDEVTSIVHLFEKHRKEAKAYIYSEANESNFKNNAQAYDIVHISSHGFANDRELNLSGIVFSQPADSSANEDGILYTGETYNLNLKADLIVLSACESGLGKLVKGEGLQALSRGFLYAGVPNVIFSLWRALDKPTKDLMEQFYASLVEGKTYAESLRLAKLKLINDQKTAFPHYWGEFVLVGR